MALLRRQNIISIPADAALSAAHRIVQLNADREVVYAVDGATPNVGVLLNKPPAAGAVAQVAAIGSVVKLEAGAAINENDAVIAVAGGRGSATVTDDDNIVGYALSPAAASAALFEVIVTAPSQHGAP